VADDEGKPEIVRRHLLFSDVVLKTFQRGVDVSESLRSIPCQLKLSWILAISLSLQMTIPSGKLWRIRDGLLFSALSPKFSGYVGVPFTHFT